MVLIRPLLQTNRDREHVRHTVVFFIFLVSNVGGCLLPTGDPPLFLGYLQGVPFLWTAPARRPLALLRRGPAGGLLRLGHPRLPPRDPRPTSPTTPGTPRRCGSTARSTSSGCSGVILAVALIVPGRPLPGTDLVVVDFVREAVMIALAALSLATTPRGLRKETEYSNAAIIEVACLFLGIFLTMQVPIEILQARGAALGLTTPAHFFWATGAAVERPRQRADLPRLLRDGQGAARPGRRGAGPPGRRRRSATTCSPPISLGAVFMGANTYIGNAPNLMVKLIAEQRRVNMPGFFGYMLYSGCVLIPLFVLVSLVFFR